MKRIYVFFTLLISIMILSSCSVKVTNIKIDFDSNGGSDVNSIYFDGTTNIKIPNNPTKDEYSFAGWYWDNETFREVFTIESLMSSGITSNITVYAKWVEDDNKQPIGTVKVIFDSNGGTKVDSVNVMPGRSISIPHSLKEGYSLEGWYTSLNGGETLDERWSFTNDKVDNDLTLYANWSINKYTITFETNDGLEINPLIQEYNSELSLPNPTREGHTFKGWYVDENLTTTYELTKMPANDQKIYAKWEINQYTISFDSNGGTEVESIKQNFETIITRPVNPTKEGYTFKDWTPNIPENMPSIDLNLTAVWEINNYTITFETNDGLEINPLIQEYNSELSLPNPTREGHTFKGWYVDENLTTPYELTKMPAKDQKIYVKWEVNTYSITFTSENELILDILEVDYGSEVDLTLVKSEEFIINEFIYDNQIIENKFEYIYAHDIEIKTIISLYEPILEYENNLFQWISLSHNVTSTYHMYINNEFVYDLGYALSYEGVEEILNNYINDGLRHEITIRAIGSDSRLSSTTSNAVIKLEAPIINETIEELNQNRKITWQPVEGATSYKIVIDGEEVTLNKNTTEYDIRDYMVYIVLIYALGDSVHISSEIKQLTLIIIENDKNYIYFGRYPQTVVDDETIIVELNKLTQTNLNGYYEYNGNEYAKLSANPYKSNYKFSNGEIIVKNKVYYFKVEPIKWLILEQADGTLTLLTDMILDQQQYYPSYSNRTIDGKTIYANNYEHSTIRAWLNNDFYNKAFNNINKELILTSFVDNSAFTTVSSSNKYACNNTNDKVYLLSYKEVISTYFKQAIASDYARARYVYVGGNNHSYWWLRSPDYTFSNGADRVLDDGGYLHDFVDDAFIGARPALKIKID